MTAIALLEDDVGERLPTAKTRSNSCRQIITLNVYGDFLVLGLLLRVLRCSGRTCMLQRPSSQAACFSRLWVRTAHLPRPPFVRDNLCGAFSSNQSIRPPVLSQGTRGPQRFLACRNILWQLTLPPSRATFQNDACRHSDQQRPQAHKLAGFGVPPCWSASVC
jgi:hypothetical protein